MPLHERDELLREFLGGWHCRALDEHWDHDPIELKSGRELDPDEVVRVLEPPSASGVGHRQPVVPDEREHGVDGHDRRLDHLLKGLSWFEGVHVHEDVLVAELGAETLHQAPRLWGCVTPPVADEDAGHRPSPPVTTPLNQRPAFWSGTGASSRAIAGLSSAPCMASRG